VEIEDVVANTCFELVIDSDTPETRAPTGDELAILRHQLDPNGVAVREVVV